MIRLLAILGILKAVVLRDGDGREYITVKRKGHFGEDWARVHPIACVGHVVLHRSGCCTGTSCYIKRWIDYKPFWRRDGK